MEPLADTLTAPSVEWAELERGNVRAQALAELRALSEREVPHAVRSIRLPSAERPTGRFRSLR